MNTVDRDPDDDGRDSVDHLIVSLRAYVTRAPTKAKKSKGEEKRGQLPASKKQFPPRIPPSDWASSSIAKLEPRLTSGFGSEPISSATRGAFSSAERFTSPRFYQPRSLRSSVKSWRKNRRHRTASGSGC
jgi:hypothetical protein